LRGVNLWEAKRLNEVTGGGWEILCMGAWREECFKGRQDRGIEGLVSLKVNDLTVRQIQGNVNVFVL